VEEPFGRPLPPALPRDVADYYPPQPERSAPLATPPADRPWINAILFGATLLTTTLVGALYHFAFTRGFSGDQTLRSSEFTNPRFYIQGLWYSTTVLAILGCHELGHYVACRRYRVDATLPFFLPFPSLTGTLGAFIRIRSRIPSKKALFDIAFAGPIAGFVIAVPALFVGLAMSGVERIPADFNGSNLGEPLLFRLAAWAIWGSLPDGVSINLHPMGFAAWFGLLATALNLFPIGQLDGGHISHAVLGRWSTYVTLVGTAVALLLTVFFSFSWALWTALLLVMLFMVGPAHPPTVDEHTPLDRLRVGLAVFALVMLILCFTPTPLEPFVAGQ
jgi:membrane-associated protease RseP (regulator of RpoE activity)